MDIETTYLSNGIKTRTSSF